MDGRPPLHEARHAEPPRRCGTARWGAGQSCTLHQGEIAQQPKHGLPHAPSRSMVIAVGRASMSMDISIPCGT